MTVEAVAPAVPAGSSGGVQPRGSLVRVAVWVVHVATPLLALWALIAQPQLDLRWEHQLSHFAIVLVAAIVAAAVGVRMGRDARRAQDGRLVLVSLAFVTSAGFLGLHALATPSVLLEDANGGFFAATPVGLVLAGALVALSAPAGGSGWVTRHERWLWIGTLTLVALWAAVSLAGLAPLTDPVDPEQARPVLLVAAAIGCLAYLVGVWRYWQDHRRRRAAVLLSLLTAFMLLAESLVAVVYGASWQLSWWLWHVTMLLAFGLVAYAARVQFRLDGKAEGLFESAGTDVTVQRALTEQRDALETLVDATREGEDPQEVASRARLVAGLFNLSERQADVLAQGATAVVTERRHLGQLATLLELGEAAKVTNEERALLEAVAGRAAQAFAPHDVRILIGTSAPAPPNGLVAPLTIKGRDIGWVAAAPAPGRALTEREQLTLRSLAAQLAVTLENVRLYRELDGLFRSYMSPEVAQALIANPEQANLGGRMSEITVFFADLKGFTPFSEAYGPSAVVQLLNTYYGAVVPVILGHGGTVLQFVGDEIFAVFNTPVVQPDHALRAVHAGLAMARAVAAAAQPGWPVFRIGINTGPAIVGNIGAQQMRTFTAIGDTTNTGARIQSAGVPGEVWIGPATYAAVQAHVRVEPVGPLVLKGKAEPLPAYKVVEVVT